MFVLVTSNILKAFQTVWSKAFYQSMKQMHIFSLTSSILCDVILINLDTKYVIIIIQ